MFLRVGFLDANVTRSLFFHPLKKSLAGCGANAIGIETNYTKQKRSPCA